MCCERLVCGACAAPVIEARCPTCRVARAEVHGAAVLPRVPEWLAVLAVLLVTLATVLAVHR